MKRSSCGSVARMCGNWCTRLHDGRRTSQVAVHASHGDGAARLQNAGVLAVIVGLVVKGHLHSRAAADEDGARVAAIGHDDVRGRHHCCNGGGARVVIATHNVRVLQVQTDPGSGDSE